MKTSEIKYPTPEHAEAAAFIIEHFSKNDHIKAILLTGSCARNKATKDSCLDIALLVKPEVYNKRKVELEEQWDSIYTKEIVIKKLNSVGVYSHVDLDIIDGVFTPKYHGWTSGPDSFELEIGNYLSYSVPLFKRGDYLL
ncbi:nucleotidyltransferase domain-containing protein, partial [candidate division WOR-3 bacterium]|nr:nucleotidyltransferase domain-containing protein [candidate division WOR-3 bacterium]